VLGIGDDCALLEPKANKLQAISVDTSVAGRHFPEDAAPFDIAYRSLNIALSDLAAMNAVPETFTLALTLPAFDEVFLQGFAEGLFQAANNSKVVLVGGDTTRGPLSITVQVQGSVAKNKAWLRSGAKVGDNLYVSGTLGNAAAGLKAYQLQQNAPELLSAYLRPEPAFKAMEKLQGVAVNSCIDISDGLLADLGHILRQSKVGAEVDCNSLPLSEALTAFCSYQQALEYALTGGDDYRLLFSSPLSLEQMPEGFYAIGRITDSGDLCLVNKPEPLIITSNGYDHFSRNAS
jgi:thiamine-monophosphate kinase